ncbi:3-dehydroquinate synthase II [Haliangium sp.]|uniref:3-dehydroquinate synthase II n=1 Tax=Haliangium sp. TaxID=2663208 RepID=UPI003D0EF225
MKTREDFSDVNLGELKAKRQQVKLNRLQGDRNRVLEEDTITLWYDSRSVDPASDAAPFRRIPNLRYTGVVLYPDNLDRLLPLLGKRMHKVLHIASLDELEALASHPLMIAARSGESSELVIASPDPAILERAQSHGVPTCMRAYVDDAPSLHESIRVGSQNDYLMIRFRDPTNIPLELVIASLQATRTILIKEIADPTDVDDAIVTLGVMEVGADGVMFSPVDHGRLDAFLAGLEPILSPTTSIETATIVRADPIGMGYRSCIDLTTLFSPTEGMIVGSTSQGGILACPEVFFLPYMELRPFRVNAGAVHSYVYNMDNRTDYMSELRAGAQVMIVDTRGKVRRASVGRMKTEIRPLRLIEAEFEGGQRINVIMQDDWHVRIFSHEGLPLNITELRPGDKVLGHRAEPGRHVGIKVDEHIIET